MYRRLWSRSHGQLHPWHAQACRTCPLMWSRYLLPHLLQHPCPPLLLCRWMRRRTPILRSRIASLGTQLPRAPPSVLCPFRPSPVLAGCRALFRMCNPPQALTQVPQLRCQACPLMPSRGPALACTWLCCAPASCRSCHARQGISMSQPAQRSCGAFCRWRRWRMAACQLHSAPCRDIS